VTIPHKQAILPYLAHLSPEAATIGAVNCVRVTPAGLIAYNTDALGFRSALLHLLHGAHPAKALVLGSGGASKAVHFVLQQLEIASIGVSRQAHSGGYTYESLTPEIVADYPLIVNATPLGTFPKVEGFPPIPYEGIGSHHFLFDLVYNPPLTEFLRRGAAHGAAVLNGYEMLVGQAEAGWKIWNEPL
ncbi:MAG: shikimate dehydrogenase, partial [Alistipes sp.]|nr:shikimate dehydrogenase [Alistipes sp.]